MKKLRKLFNLLPAFAFAVISGLGVVLDNDHKTKPVMADNSVLISNRAFTNYHLSYSNSNVTFNMFFDFNVNFYHDISTDDFYFVLNATYHLRDWNITYNNVVYPFYQSSSVEDYVYTMTTSRYKHLGSSTSSDFQFIIGAITTDTSVNSFERNYFGTGTNLWIYVYRINYQFLFSSGSSWNPANHSVVDTIAPNWNYAGYDFGNSDSPSAITSSSIKKTGNTIVGAYTIDYSQSNYDLGYNDGYSAGYNDGFNVGYESGNSTGYDNGYNVGYQAGVDSQQQAIEDAYASGYSAGYDEGFSVDSTAATIFSGILQVGMLPVNVLLAIFNFEILGINLSAFISAILTVCLTVIVLRTVTGGKNSE